MNTVSRPYRPGDEVQINRLYRSITGRDRGAAEFAWEWLDIWAGQGSMSHPDHCSSGLYSAHERECFEKERKKYSFFFTAAGEVAGGAVGRVRMKLGYVAFDNWGKYMLWLRTHALREEFRAMVDGARTELFRHLLAALARRGRELRDDPKVSDHVNWYITELVLEGRLRGTSPA